LGNILAMPETRVRLSSQGLEVVYVPSEPFAAYVVAEL
jgi:hypothetical protein